MKDIKSKFESLLNAYNVSTLSKIDELKTALFAVKQSTPTTIDDKYEITEENNPFLENKPENSGSTKQSLLDGLKRQAINKSKAQSGKKVKPIYSWEKGNNEKKPIPSDIELPHNLDNNSFSDQMSRVGKMIEEQLMNVQKPRHSSPSELSPRRSYVKKKEEKDLIHAPLVEQQLSPRNLHLEIEMNEEDYAKLKKRRSMSLIKERPRSGSPRVVGPRGDKIRELSMSDLSNSSDSASSSGKKNFLQKGKGRLASDGNPFLKIYSQPQILYNTTNYLAGLEYPQEPLDNLDQYEKSQLYSAINEKSPAFSVADVEGLYITTAGPYQDPKDNFFRPDQKNKWVVSKGFQTATPRREEFTRDKSLPQFINSGLRYESSNPNIVQQKLRADDKDKEKMISPRGFISSFGGNGCAPIDKQYSFGFYSPTKGSVHSFTAPIEKVRTTSKSPILTRQGSNAINSSAINVIARSMASPKQSPRVSYNHY